MSNNTVPFIINGQECNAHSTFDVVSPATGEKTHQGGIATEADAIAAVNAAAKAFASWRNVLSKDRREILLRAAKILIERQAELATYMIDEIGSSHQYANQSIVKSAELIKDVAGRICSLQGDFPACGSPDLSAMVTKVPYGVIFAIAPWNAPYVLGTRAIVSPLATGNTVVFKGSELSPRVMKALASVFHEAGLPDGVLNFITTNSSNAAAVTNAIISHPRVKKINFTGSTNVGRIIAKLAAEYLKPAVLELGGKAPAIVWKDADLDLAAGECAKGAFFFSGQICMGTERILIHKDVSRQFRQKLLASIDAMFPSERGELVLINEQAVAKSKHLLQDAVGKGAVLLRGTLDNNKEASSTRLRPSVVDHVKPDMDIYKIESFGPLVSLIDVNTEEEALRIANDTEYGLTSAIFTEDLRTGFRFANGIESGASHINHMTIHDDSVLPHGGVKSSGYGRFNGTVGLEEWLWTKSITWKN